MGLLLNGSVILVTGGASGIGRAVCLDAAAEGAKVLVSDINELGGMETVKQIRQLGGKASFHRADVARPGDVEALIDQAVRTYGRLDGAVNNAGINCDIAMVDELDEEDWARVIQVNLSGVFYCMKYELRAMIANGAGSIVNMSSIYGLVGRAALPAYAAAKHGVVGLTRSSAIAHAIQGVRINALCPGFVPTAINDPILKVVPLVAEQINNAYPIGRMGTPQEMAKATSWLLSDASSFVTGATLVADGGFTAG
ncbi:MAG: glucose 1-dehydrogenase [Pikeienuella sp.]